MEMAIRQPPVQSTVLLFGDQTSPWIDQLFELYKQASKTPWLHKFLDRLTAVTQAELKAMTLDARLRACFGHFTSLQELGEKYHNSSDEFGVVTTLLLHAVKAGILLRLVKQRPQLLHADVRTEYVGISGGLLTMSALAVAHDFDSLYVALLDVTSMILRFCAMTSIRSRAYENEGGAWGWAVLGMPPDDLTDYLAHYQQSAGIPVAKQAKVGIVGSGWCTIIGPPSVLRSFMEQCPDASALPNQPLEIKAMQHVLSVSPEEIEHMLGTNSAVLDRPLRTPHSHFWGLDAPATNYSCWGDLMKEILCQVLNRPLDIPALAQALNASLAGVDSIDILQIGTCNQVSEWSSAFQAGGRVVNIQDTHAALSSTVDEGLFSGRIAVVGIAGRGPGCDNVDEFWDVIMSKQDLCSEVPKDRFDLEEHYCAPQDRGSERCKMTTRYGCFMNGPGQFDSRFFHISPREAMLMDPGHRQFLMAAYEALEMAGYSDGRTRTTDPHHIATLFAQATDDWLNQTHGTTGCDAYTMPGMQRAFAPGRLAWQFKWEGPTYSLDAACAGATAGIHLACVSLMQKDIDMAVSGAANILSWPHSFNCLCNAGVLSTTGNCKPFRDDADGYCRADFTGAVVLKRLEDAVAHNDNILAVIAGSGRNHSGNSTSITTSDGLAQERLFRKVVRQAHISPDDISYVEMHGTGTQVGDPAEMGAVASFFQHRSRIHGPLHVGGVKANVGHSEAAAGIAELFKCVMMFQKNIVPPQAGLPHALNPRFPPLAELGIEIPSEPLPYSHYSQKPGKPRRILMNNFDAAGGNACLVLEDYLPADKKQAVQDPRNSHVVAVSARTPAAYTANLRNLAAWLKSTPDVRVEDLAYTTCARRMHHPLRFACSVTSVSDLINKLEVATTSSPPVPAQQEPPVVFVFTGQGSHYAGMGAELYRTSPVFRETVQLCATICGEQGFPPLVEIISDDGADLSTMNTAQIQLALVTLEIALTAFWRSIGIEPALVIGHSLGEYAALHAAGVLSLFDTLYLVGKRALLLLERCEVDSCGMLSVTSSADHMQEILVKHPLCSIACINGPNATVVSGASGDLAALQKDVTARNQEIRTTMLSLPYAFHSFQVDPVLDDFTQLAAGATYLKPKIPVASTLLGSIVEQEDVFDQHYLARQMRLTVDFVGGLNAVAAHLQDPFWLEIGPAPVCSSFVKATLSPSTSRIALSLDAKASDWSSISKSLSAAYASGVEVDWLALHIPFEKSLKLLNLPAYAWEKKDYWITFKKETAIIPEQIATARLPEPMHTTCAQYLVSKSSSPKIRVTFRASIADAGFMALIDGHKMQEQGLASGSVFCDAAATVAKYALEYSGRTGVSAASLSLYDPQLLAPLTRNLVGDDGELFTTALVDDKSANTLLCSFEAKSSTSGSVHDLGSITIRVTDPQKTQAAWDQTSFFIHSRMSTLIKDVKEGHGHRMQPEVLYQLFLNAIDFALAFKGIQEAFIARNFEEAAARIILSDNPVGTRFTASPYWAEALVHLAGFMVQGNPAKSDKTTFVVMGFASGQQTVDMQPGKEYMTYTRINRWEERTAFCDVFVFDSESEKVVMQCRDLRCTEMPKAAWRHILQGASHAVEKAKDGGRTQIAITAVDSPGKTSKDADISTTDKRSENLFERIVTSISKSTGTDSSELTDATRIADLGVDSIMAIEIVSVVKTEHGVDLPAQFVFEYPTVGDLRREFGGAPPSRGEQATSSASPATSLPSDNIVAADMTTSGIKEASPTSSSTVFVDRDPDPATTPPPADADADADTNPKPQPSVRITLLQGRRAPGRVPLYLMADGTGSVATYLHIPPLKDKRPVFGVDSPFLQCPSRLTRAIGIPGVAALVIDALTAHLPDGPLLLGGFSAGCHVAYEVCRQLGAADRKVQGLILIDLRAPLACPPSLTAAAIEAEAEAGVAALVATVASDDLWSATAAARRAHLHAYFVAVRAYAPPPLPLSARPKHTAVIWASRGLVGRAVDNPALRAQWRASNFPLDAYAGFMEDARISPMAALVPHKTAAELNSANGWERFVGGETSVFVVDGDHLDLCMPTHARLLFERLQSALELF